MRGAVRDALHAHYEAGHSVVYQRNGKIYKKSKPGSKGRVVATVSGNRKRS